MAKFSLSLKGFREFLNRLTPSAFERRLQGHVGKATKLNGLIAERLVKKGIQSGNYAKNSPATVAIKGSSKPLVDSSQLFRGITSAVERWDRAVIGVLKNARYMSKQGKKWQGSDLMSVAAILHYGCTVGVTDEMRKFFFHMASVEPGKWKPLSPKTTTIVIPPRPYLNPAVSAEAKAEYEKNWNAAVMRALRGEEP